MTYKLPEGYTLKELSTGDVYIFDPDEQLVVSVFEIGFLNGLHYQGRFRDMETRRLSELYSFATIEEAISSLLARRRLGLTMKE